MADTLHGYAVDTSQSQNMSQNMSQNVPQSMSHNTSQNMSQNMSQNKSQSTSKYTQMVVDNPSSAAILIGVLVLIIVFMFVYYCGIWKIGPFVACTCTKIKKDKKPTEEAEGFVATDPETESLIDSINKA